MAGSQFQRQLDQNQSVTVNSDHDNDNIAEKHAAHESDGSSFKQEGVRQVEAITSVWTTPILWVTFIL